MNTSSKTIKTDTPESPVIKGPRQLKPSPEMIPLVRQKAHAVSKWNDQHRLFVDKFNSLKSGDDLTPGAKRGRKPNNMGRFTNEN
jgi:hypothetical protein